MHKSIGERDTFVGSSSFSYIVQNLYLKSFTDIIDAADPFRRYVEM